MFSSQLNPMDHRHFNDSITSYDLVCRLQFPFLYIQYRPKPNLTPKWTRKWTQGLPWVRFESAFQKFASALGPLGVRSESALGPFGDCSAPALGGLLCALMREADPALLLPPTSLAPCIFQIHCPAISFCSSDRKHKHVQDSQAISLRTSTKSPEFRSIFCKELLFWANMFIHRSLNWNMQMIDIHFFVILNFKIFEKLVTFKWNEFSMSELHVHVGI